MIMPGDNDYQETKQIMLGEKILKTEFKPLAAWIDETYNVKTVNIYYDTIYDGTPRLGICFETEEESLLFKGETVFNYDTQKQEAIANKFKEILKDQADLTKKSFFDLFKKAPKYKTENLFVIFNAFKPIAEIDAVNSIPKEKIEILKEALGDRNLWEISTGFGTVTFFFHKEEQIKKYENSATLKEWTAQFFLLLSAYDTFGYFKKEVFSILLDSKENFDKNYRSNWYYYYK